MYQGNVHWSDTSLFATFFSNNQCQVVKNVADSATEVFVSMSYGEKGWNLLNHGVLALVYTSVAARRGIMVGMDIDRVAR